MKLKAKLILFILLPTLLFFSGTIYYVSHQVKEISEKNAMQYLKAQGEGLSYELRRNIENPLDSVRALALSLQGLMENGSTPSRETTNTMIQQLLNSNPDLITSWMFWEENAYDGKDAEYKNTLGHDQTGRFIPVWTKNESGQFQVEALMDYDKPGSLKDNFDYVLKNGESYIFEPYSYELNGESVLMTSIATPVIVNKNVVGIIGVDISLDNLNKAIEEFTFYETGFAGLMTNSGNVLAHKDKELIGTNYFESSAMSNHKEVKNIIEAVKTGKESLIQGMSNSLGTNVYRLFTPMEFSGVKAPWSAFLAAPQDEVMKEANSLTNTIIMISGIAIVILAAIIFLVTTSIVKTIQAAVSHAMEISNGDFSRIPPEIHLKRKDEMGDLARAFNTISVNMSTLIKKVQEGSNKVLESAKIIDDAAIQSSSAANEVATSIAEVSGSAENQMQSAEESAKSIEEMTLGIQRNASLTSGVAEASNTMEEQANAGQEVVQLAIQQMNLIQNETLEAKNIIEQLLNQANKIDSIVSMITDISNQTNLLALNAAIEAARAGEAGKGFAVVADEVRKLADETNTSAFEIQQLVEGIITQSNSASHSMNSNEEQVKVGINRIKEVENVFDSIISSIKNAGKDIDELAAVMEQMAAISEEVSASSEEIASSAEVAAGHSQQVASAAEQQLATMEELSKTTSSLKTLSTDLSDLLKQFKI